MLVCFGVRAQLLITTMSTEQMLQNMCHTCSLFWHHANTIHATYALCLGRSECHRRQHKCLFLMWNEVSSLSVGEWERKLGISGRYSALLEVKVNWTSRGFCHAIKWRGCSWTKLCLLCTSTDIGQGSWARASQSWTSIFSTTSSGASLPRWILASFSFLLCFFRLVGDTFLLLVSKIMSGGYSLQRHFSSLLDDDSGLKLYSCL